MVRKLAVVLAAAALGASALALAPPGDRASVVDLRARTSRPLLGIVFIRNSARLVRLDPGTLRQRPGRRLELGRLSASWSFSPDGSLLALGDDMLGRLALVDPKRLRLLRVVGTGIDGPVTDTAWVGGALLAVAYRTCWEDPCAARQGPVVVAFDPGAASMTWQRELDGSLHGVASTASELVLLLGPRWRIAETTLAVVRADGTVRTVALTRILAGSQPGSPTVRGQQTTPALALDPEGRRAFVVAAGAPVAEVDLATLEVTYHELARPVSLLGRLHDWLEPAAEAKELFAGPVRSARWLPPSTLAVFGRDIHTWTDDRGRTQMLETPAGITLIDTRDWSARTLDRRATALEVADGGLLAYAWRYDSARRRASGMGLAAYDAAGALRFRALGAKPILWVQAVGRRAFVRPFGYARGYTIVDVRTGRAIRTVAGEMPLVLSPG